MADYVTILRGGREAFEKGDIPKMALLRLTMI